MLQSPVAPSADAAVDGERPSLRLPHDCPASSGRKNRLFAVGVSLLHKRLFPCYVG